MSMELNKCKRKIRKNIFEITSYIDRLTQEVTCFNATSVVKRAVSMKITQIHRIDYLDNVAKGV